MISLRRSKEMASMDERMTSQLLNVQRQAVALALVAQRAEDEQNAAFGVASGE